jgi:putative endonuclease
LASGRRGEDDALAFLTREGLSLVTRNWKLPPRPHAGGHGGELDLVMRDGDLLVIVEVRSSNARFAGGAAYTVGPAKQRQLGLLAQQFTKQLAWKPRALRFDVVTVAHPGLPKHPDHAVQWYRNAIAFQ